MRWQVEARSPCSCRRAYYFLRERRKPPIRHLRRKGVPMALATDCNPGTSPIVSLPLVMNMACTLFRMTPEEALAGVTRNAARALGIERRTGTLAPGKAADFVLWDAEASRLSLRTTSAATNASPSSKMDGSSTTRGERARRPIGERRARARYSRAQRNRTSRLVRG